MVFAVYLFNLKIIYIVTFLALITFKQEISPGHNPPYLQVRPVYVQKRRQNAGHVRRKYRLRTDLGARRQDAAFLWHEELSLRRGCGFTVSMGNALTTCARSAFATSSPRFQKNAAAVVSAENVRNVEHARWVVTKALIICQLSVNHHL